MRTCPNRNCRLVHDGAVNQCPECGANMGRTPDPELDPNMALYAARDRAMRERSLESRLAARMNRGRGEEFDLGAPPQVHETASDVAGQILGLYGKAS